MTLSIIILMLVLFSYLEECANADCTKGSGSTSFFLLRPYALKALAGWVDLSFIPLAILHIILRKGSLSSRHHYIIIS